MFGRGGVFAKNSSLETKSLDWYVSQIPFPNMIYMYLYNILSGNKIVLHLQYFEWSYTYE
jgi:hypothetical protein